MPDKGTTNTRLDLEQGSGVEMRLSRVAAAATQRPRPRTLYPDLWERLMMLKSLRDDISHANAAQAASPGSMYGSIFARMFDAPLLYLTDDVDRRRSLPRLTSGRAPRCWLCCTLCKAFVNPISASCQDHRAAY
jgi:hypothetical protein